MAAKTPHRFLGRRSRVASPMPSRMVMTTPMMADTSISPAWASMLWSRLFSRPLMQLQGTAMLMMYLLRNFFSSAFIQPLVPIK